jgi:enoyl-CoA hydratase
VAYRNLEIGNRNAVRLITVNRPDKLNALNRETLNELTLAFNQAAQDDAVRAVVLGGAGDKAFVAGADISEMNGYTPVQAQSFSRTGQRLMSTIERLGKPVVARIQGFALGGGMELAMACHLRIASEKAKFGQPEINLGLIPGFGGTQRLLRLAGRSAALELCLTGSTITAQRAYELGVVNRAVAPEALMRWLTNSPPLRRWPPPAFWTPCCKAAKHRSIRDWSSKPRLSHWPSRPRTCAKGQARFWKSVRRCLRGADSEPGNGERGTGQSRTVHTPLFHLYWISVEVEANAFTWQRLPRSLFPAPQPRSQSMLAAIFLLTRSNA